MKDTSDNECTRKHNSGITSNPRVKTRLFQKISKAHKNTLFIPLICNCYQLVVREEHSTLKYKLCKLTFDIKTSPNSLQTPHFITTYCDRWLTILTKAHLVVSHQIHLTINTLYAHFIYICIYIYIWILIHLKYLQTFQ